MLAPSPDHAPPPAPDDPTADPAWPEYLADVPLEVATRAHAGTSHVPDDRGRQEREGYARRMLADLAQLERLATTPEKRAALDREWPIYRKRYKLATLRALEARSRCVSTMIAGRSRFNVSRAQKASDRADAAAREADELRASSLAAMRKLLTPELQPIRVEDGDAVDRLRAKLQALQSAHATMIAVNRVIRQHEKAGREAQHAAIVALGRSEAFATRALTPDHVGRIGFPSYALANSSAEIRRIEKRIAEVTAKQAAPVTRYRGTLARVVEVPADNRIRITFADKPGAEVRARLKRAGFRWAPSMGAWQAYPSHATRAAARELAGDELPPCACGVCAECLAPIAAAEEAERAAAEVAAPTAPAITFGRRLAGGMDVDEAAEVARRAIAERAHGLTIDAGDVAIETTLIRSPAIDLGGGRQLGGAVDRATLEERRRRVLAEVAAVPDDAIGTLAHVDAAAAPHVRAALVAFVEAQPGAPWDGWRDALEAFRRADEASRCACLAGRYCDRLHDPAACPCTRCTVTTEHARAHGREPEPRWCPPGTDVPVPAGHPGLILVSLSDAGTRATSYGQPPRGRSRKGAARG